MGVSKFIVKKSFPCGFFIKHNLRFCLGLVLAGLVDYEFIEHLKKKLSVNLVLDLEKRQR